MAIGRLSLKTGKTGRAGPHAAYIAREGQYVRYLERDEKLEGTDAGNLPPWAQADTQVFWQAADAFERSNGTTYREMEIALPRELDTEQREDLVRAFVAQEIGDKHAYQWAIHTPLAADGKAQPHVHLMFSERQVDGIERDPQQYFKRYNSKNPEQGGARKGYGAHAGQTLSRAERVEELKALRGRWQDMANTHLQQLGHSARIDLRSHIERGTGLEAEAKQLPSQWRGEGRENVLEFRQARAEQTQATEQVRKIVPNVQAEIIDLEAQRQHQLHLRQEAAALAQAQRIGGMRSAELRAEIERVRLPDVDEVVGRDPLVQTARQEQAALSGQLQKVQAAAAIAQHAIAVWRTEHPRRAWFHDKGLVQSSYLTQYEQAGRKAESQAFKLAPQVNEAGQRVKQVEASINERTVKVQAPLREQVATMEAIWKQKVTREMAAKRQEQKLEQALSAFKSHARSRLLNISGYDNAGREWKALPEGMRKTIEDFNRLPKEEKKVALVQIREKLKRQPEHVEKLVQQLELGRGMGRGMSR
ncbi:MAG: MobA/MobL family protein [Nitrosospira sp.]